MAETIRRPSLRFYEKHLSGLENLPRMLDAVRREPQFINTLYGDYDLLLARFNGFKPDDPTLTIMPGVTNLRAKLNNQPLPRIHELSAHDLVTGVVEAARLMYKGQSIVKEELPSSPDAIQSASKKTGGYALIVGVAGHFLERTIFNYFRERGIKDWTKDDVLFALEDIVVLTRVEYQNSRGHLSGILGYVASEESDGDEGGLGWRTREQVHAFTEAYEKLHGITL